MVSDIRDLEKDKFDYLGNVKVFTGGNLLSGVNYDEAVVTYPTSSTELYTYNLISTLQASILVTYTDSTKTILTSVKRV